ncbi:MAG: nuclear transport factor 2 family protein [Pseudorhodoplanes sp.]
MNDFDQIRELARHYCDGLYDGNVDLLAKIFHPKSRLHVITDGKLAEIEQPAYLKIVAGRASPRSLNAKRREEIVSISITSPHAAVLTLNILLTDKFYTDQLALIKDEGKWQIMSKIYYLNPA